ncbi:tetratricopeptide repeat-containing diguanylate cyclase [Shewanella algicola]|uniref:tetratricopeptide repeat-containing diguanylate cyclase n=1 Tax=Shewanella algicola TaxID=640633 RepID=UPI0024940562|nr:GGDEF domain-containing protein [Shewanella algicola]
MMSCNVNANTIDNARADEIYQRIDRGEVSSNDELNLLLKEYKNSIAVDDTVRQQLNIRQTCWSHPANNAEQLNTAINYADEYLNIYKQPSPSLIQVDLTLCKILFLHQQGQNQSVLKPLDNAINNAYLLEDPRLIADSRSLRGTILSYMGNFSAALEDLITAQNLYESLKLDYWANANLRELANSYRRFGDPDTALTYQTKLETSFLEKNQHFEANLITIEMAMSLEELGRYQEANDRYQKAREFWLKENELIAAADMAVSIGGNFINLNRLDQAKTMLEQAQKHITPDIASSYSYMNLYLAKVHHKLGNHSQALEYIINAEKAFNDHNNARGLNLVLQLKSQIYQALEQWSDAYYTLLAYVEAHDALDKKTMSDRNSEMQARFNTDKIQSENNLLVQRDKDKEQQLQMMHRNEQMQIIIIILVVLILLIVSLFAYKQVVRKKLFRNLALTDELTNLSNRRDTYSQGKAFLNEAQQTDKPFSIISFDVDHFKAVNDKLGHDTGDKVLVKLAAISSSMMRETDVVGRVGGEEFLILLPNINNSIAVDIANRLINAVDNYDWSRISPELHLTVSAGVVSYTDETNLSPLLLKADKALYCAKAAGRNCVKAG